MTAMRLTGLTGLRWRRLAPALYCFNYHRIGQSQLCAYDRNVFSCTVERFEEHVKLLAERFEIATLARIESLGDHAPDRPLALITFDDGYIDNFELAVPVLLKHRATAVFFLPTGYVGTAHVPWWDQIAYIIRQSTATRIELEGLAEPIRLTEAGREEGIRRVLALVKQRSVAMEEQVEEIRAACGGLRLPEDAQPLFMNWDQAGEMADAGMDIGSHTHSHEILSHLSEVEQLKELRQSKQQLEQHLGRRICAIAYPVGDRSAYTATTCRLAREAGYTLGFNFARHINPLPLTDPMDIGRLAVGGNPARRQMQEMACYPALA